MAIVCEHVSKPAQVFIGTFTQFKVEFSIRVFALPANKPLASKNRKLDKRHTHPFNGPLSGTTRVSWYQKGKTNLDFTEARDREWQWNLLGHMQVCTSHQTDNHASTPPLSFLQAGCPSCHPTNSVKALKASNKLI